jgi:hypothetical protein
MSSLWGAVIPASTPILVQYDIVKIFPKLRVRGSLIKKNSSILPPRSGSKIRETISLKSFELMSLSSSFKNMHTIFHGKTSILVYKCKKHDCLNIYQVTLSLYSSFLKCFLQYSGTPPQKVPADFVTGTNFGAVSIGYPFLILIGRSIILAQNMIMFMVSMA